MVSKKRPPRRRVSTPRSAARSSRPTVVPDEIAVRYAAGRARAVTRALSPFGRLSPYPRQRIVILHRRSRAAAARVRAALAALKQAGDVELVMPVVVDPVSGMRQVLTDEIVLRLKPGRAARALAALEAEHGVTVSRRNEFDPAQYIVKVPKASGTKTLEVARSLGRSADVAFASPNLLTQIKR